MVDTRAPNKKRRDLCDRGVPSAVVSRVAVLTLRLQDLRQPRAPVRREGELATTCGFIQGEDAAIHSLRLRLSSEAGRLENPRWSSDSEKRPRWTRVPHQALSEERRFASRCSVGLLSVVPRSESHVHVAESSRIVESHGFLLLSETMPISCALRLRNHPLVYSYFKSHIFWASFGLSQVGLDCLRD